MKNQHITHVALFIHLCAYRDKTQKENHLKTEAESRHRRMSLLGNMGEARHAVDVQRCVSADCQLIRHLHILHLLHLLTLHPENTLLAPKPLLLRSLLIYKNLHLFSQYLLFPETVLNLVIHSLLSVSVCAPRQKKVPFCLYVCHSSLVLPSLGLTLSHYHIVYRFT